MKLLSTLLVGSLLSLAPFAYANASPTAQASSLRCFEDGSCVSTETGTHKFTKPVTLSRAIRVVRNLLPDGYFRCHTFYRVSWHPIARCTHTIDSNNSSRVSLVLHRGTRLNYSIRSTYCLPNRLCED